MKLSVIALALLGVLLLAEFSEGHYRRGSYRGYRRYRGSRYRSCRRTTTTTTTTTTTAAPAAPVADADLTALIDFFNQLLTLDPALLENLAASLAVTPVDIIPVTVPRLRRREVNGDMYEDPCKDQDHEELKAYLSSPSELRKYISSNKDCCTVKAALRYLTQDNFQQLGFVTEKLLTNRLEEVQNCSQSTETRLRIIDTILGQSGSDDDDIVLQLGQAQMHKRQTRRPNPSYLIDNILRLRSIILNLKVQLTREDVGRIVESLRNIRSPLSNAGLTSLLGQFISVPTTTTPAPLSQDFTTLLTNVMAPIFGSAAQQLSTVITNLYPSLVNYQQMLANLVQNTQFTDKPATCFIMYNFLFNSNSLGLGQQNLIKNLYNLANCSVDDVVDVMNTPAQPTSSSSTGVDNPQSCGVSNALGRTLSVAQSDLLVFNRIMGGTDAGSCEKIPWQVRLTILDSQGRENGLCGGSIISPNYILTAAHCIPSSGSITVTAGDYDTTETESTEQVRSQIPLSSVTVHPNYYTTSQGVEMNDIALIKLDTALTLTDCVKTVCLKANFNPDGQACTVSGWGTDRSGGNVQTILQVADIPTFNGSQCDKEFSQTNLGNYVGSETNNLCAGYSNVGGIDSCQGDSGGPLVCLDSSTNTMVQAGIVSYGGECGDPDLPGIYTNVASYVDWISQTTGNN